MLDARCSVFDATKRLRQTAHETPARPKCSISFPQITQIDADIFFWVDLRYLRHLRADSGGRVVMFK